MEKISRRQLGYLVAGAGAALLVNPAAASTPVAGDLGGRLDALVRAYAETGQFGGAVLVVRRGETLLRAAYGTADLVTGAPNTPETAYQIASITKGFTALALVQLSEAGQLSLDDPITDHLPEVVHGERGDVRATIRHLLSHTAGVPDFIGFYNLENPLSYPRTLDQLVADIVARELEFTPGTEYRYSNSGYTLAGLILERVSGQSYEAYLREQIWRPAGMTSTFLVEPPDPAPPPSRGYATVNGQRVALSDFNRLEIVWAAGGLSSTVDDLLRWHEALLTGLLAPPAAIAAMYEPVQDAYGLGWEIETIAGRRSTGHTGHTIGYDSKLARFLADDVVIVLLSNEQEAPVTDIVQGLAAIVFSG